MKSKSFYELGTVYTMHGQLTDRLTIRTAELHSDIYLNTYK